jgi:hypothetical protein
MVMEFDSSLLLHLEPESHRLISRLTNLLYTQLRNSLETSDHGCHAKTLSIAYAVWSFWRPMLH